MAVTARSAPRLSSRSRENLLWIGPLTALLLLRAATGGMAAAPPVALEAAGALLLLTGAALRLCARQWKAERAGDGLVTDGLYAWLRHPLYAGSFLLGSGFCALLGDPLFFAAFAALFWFSHGAVLRREEAELEALFGEAWREYRRSTPALLPRPVPGRIRPERPAEGVLRECDALGAVVGLPLAIHLARAAAHGPGSASVATLLLLALALLAVALAWARLKRESRALLARERRRKAETART